MDIVVTVILRTVFIYFIILLVMRLMGKREIGQLSPFDFVVAIMIGEVVAMPMEQPEIPLLRGLAPLFVLVALEIAFSYAALHSRWLRHFVCGAPQIVVRNGQILHREMRRARYNLDDLLSKLREKGYPDPAEVAEAVLENSGELSVIPKSECSPVTRKDLNLQPAAAGLPLVLVADGEVVKPNLAAAERDEAWLEDELRTRGLSLKEVFLAALSPDGRLFVSGREGFAGPAAKKKEIL
ncbi:MAG TPA: DUF421 domain-containing protein [Desulfotomaculum sp.]|nr:DUF421 domain-containing protein [Desulfotomaculum sp.]